MSGAVEIAGVVWKSFLDLLYPPRCQCCGRFIDSLICSECFEKLQPIQPPFCAQCGMPFNSLAKTGELCGDCAAGRFPLERARSAYHYGDVVRKAIHTYKYRGKSRLAVPFGELMSARFDEYFGDVPVDALVPVPLHKRRERTRGFNQARLLCQEISRLRDIAVLDRALTRVKATRPQIELTAKQRFSNVRNAFQVTRPETISGKNVLLVDDMFTTGATLRECARTLKRAGAAGVYGYTLARG